jgi:hypothetical protein
LDTTRTRQTWAVAGVAAPVCVVLSQKDSEDADGRRVHELLFFLNAKIQPQMNWMNADEIG